MFQATYQVTQAASLVQCRHTTGLVCEAWPASSELCADITSDTCSAPQGKIKSQHTLGHTLPSVLQPSQGAETGTELLDPHGAPSRVGLGSLPSVYLKNASDGECEARCSGDQEELREAQTKGQNPAKEEAPKNPQE